MARVMKRNRLSHIRQDQQFSRPFRLNKHSPQARGLVGWWPTLLNSGNKLPDKSGFGNDGAFPGGTPNPAWATSTQGSVLSYDGNEDYISMGDSDLFTPNFISISVWFKRVNNDRRLVSKDNNSPVTDRDWLIKLTASDTAQFSLWNQDNAIGTASGGTTISTTAFHIITGTWDGANIRVYVDGIQQAEAARTGTSVNNSGTALELGRRQDAAEHYSGLIGDVRIYNRALSPSEVYQLYAPQTRWELYEPIPRLFPVGVAAAPAAGNPWWAYAQQQ